MNFDSKSYLYGKYMEFTEGAKHGTAAYEELIDLLQDFSIQPGSIVEGKDDGVKLLHFRPKFSDSDYVGECYIKINGAYEFFGNNHTTWFLINNNKMNVLVGGDSPKAGLYCIDFANIEGTKVDYFDKKVTDSLFKDYNMNYRQIMHLSTYKLKNLGFTPPDNETTYENVDRDEIKYYAIHEYHDNNIDSLLELLDKANDKGSK